MKFTSGARLHRFKMTVPSMPLGPNRTGPFRILNSDYERPEQIRFRFEWGNGHELDTLLAQEKYNWSDRDREIVEQYLLNKNNGFYKKLDGRGIFPAEDQPDVNPEPASEEPEKTDGPEWTQCSARVETDEGWKACPNQAVEGNIHCDEHLEIAYA